MGFAVYFNGIVGLGSWVGSGRGLALVKVVWSSRETFVHGRGLGVVEEMARWAGTGACPCGVDWPGGVGWSGAQHAAPLQL